MQGFIISATIYITSTFSCSRNFYPIVTVTVMHWNENKLKNIKPECLLTVLLNYFSAL